VLKARAGREVVVSAGTILAAKVRAAEIAA
jgi:hypothetical protein